MTDKNILTVHQHQNQYHRASPSASHHGDANLLEPLFHERKSGNRLVPSNPNHIESLATAMLLAISSLVTFACLLR